MIKQMIIMKYYFVPFFILFFCSCALKSEKQNPQETIKFQFNNKSSDYNDIFINTSFVPLETTPMTLVY